MKIEIKERIEKIKNKEIPEGYRKTKFGPIPKSWKEITIASLVKEKKELCSDETTPLYSLTIEAGVIPKSERYEREHLVKDTESAYKNVSLNEFAYNPMNARFGAIGRLLENKTVKVSKYYNVFEVKKNVDLKFFEAVIKSKRALNYYDSISTGTLEEKKRVHYNDFIKIEIPFPPIEEQVKISTILSKWDEGISNQEKLIEAKKKYKKGMMQKIFSQELRFKDENGNDYPEWEEKKLGEVLIKNSIKNKDEKILRVQSISNKVGFVEQEELFQDRIIASSNKRNYYIIQKGMFAYNPSRIDVGSLAYKTDEFPAVISPLYVSFKANQEYLFDRFLLNWFKENEFKKQMYSLFEGSVRNTLSYDALSKVHIMIPCLSEQIKISNVFLILDKEIELLEKELSVLKSEKQSLMSMLLNGVVRTV